MLSASEILPLKSPCLAAAISSTSSASVGYRVTLKFLALDNVQIAINRVARRVAHGGHDIPVPVIRRCFEAGLQRLHSDYKHAVDEWLLYDNSGDTPVLLKRGINP